MNSTGTSQQKFDYIIHAGNTSGSYDRNADLLKAFPHHAQGYRFDRGPGQSSHDMAQESPPGIDVDRHTPNRVDQAQRVGPAVLGGPRYLHYARDVR